MKLKEKCNKCEREFHPILINNGICSDCIDGKEPKKEKKSEVVNTVSFLDLALERKEWKVTEREGTVFCPNNSSHRILVVNGKYGPFFICGRCKDDGNVGYWKSKDALDKYANRK